MKLLALDFDGVISDSAAECFWVALRAYVALRPRSEHRALLERLAPAAGGAPPTPARIVAEPSYRAFLEAMPLGNRAEDFAVELAAFEQGAALPDQSAYDALRDAQPREFLQEFHTRFYAEREALSGAHRQAWLELIAPYPEFVALMRRRSTDAEFAIATAKDRRSVEILLDRYGIADLVPPQRLLDKETGVSKRAHLEALRERAGVEFAEMTFLDDKVNHLDSVAGLGVRCTLAGWGYNGPREHALARERGHAVCATVAECDGLLWGESAQPSS